MSHRPDYEKKELSWEDGLGMIRGLTQKMPDEGSVVVPAMTRGQNRASP
jgi:hypothetical protein